MLKYVDGNGKWQPIGTKVQVFNVNLMYQKNYEN
jgi:hypothetical protein